MVAMQDGAMQPDATDDRMNLSLSNDEALVFFEWLTRFNASRPEFVDQAEQRVLWNLEAMLESGLVPPLRADYDALLNAARDRVRDSRD